MTEVERAEIGALGEKLAGISSDLARNTRLTRNWRGCRYGERDLMWRRRGRTPWVFVREDQHQGDSRWGGVKAGPPTQFTPIAKA